MVLHFALLEESSGFPEVGFSSQQVLRSVDPQTLSAQSKTAASGLDVWVSTGHIMVLHFALLEESSEPT
jgi:hypothetical protein